MVIIFETLDTVEMQKKTLERQLQEITKKDRDVQLLMTIPGIGTVNACTIRAYIDPTSSFQPTAALFHGYKIGRITRRGPQELRTAIVQCVVAMVRMESKTGNLDLMKQYHLLKDAKSSGKAIVATARKMTRIIYVMLKEGKPFDSSKLIKT